MNIFYVCLANCYRPEICTYDSGVAHRKRSFSVVVIFIMTYCHTVIIYWDTWITESLLIWWVAPVLFLRWRGFSLCISYMTSENYGSNHFYYCGSTAYSSPPQLCARVCVCSFSHALWNWTGLECVRVCVCVFSSPSLRVTSAPLCSSISTNGSSGSDSA